MRPFELLTALLLAASFLAFAFPGRPRWLKVLPGLAFLVALGHLLAEGYRWQMVPLYALAVLLFVFTLPVLLRPDRAARPRFWKRIAGPAAGLLLVAAAAAPPVLLPVPHAPPPAGPYRVGTFSIMLVDESRRELYSGNPDEPRRFMVQFWYPADPGPQARTAPWTAHPEIFGPVMSRYLHFPSFFLDHVRYVGTDSHLDAPLSEAQPSYPVLVYSHGWNGFLTVDTSLMQELASHGYVVISVEHTYGALLSVFPDGRVAYNNPAALPFGLPDEEYYAAANRLVTQWADDIAFTLDTLAEMNAGDVAHDFQGGLDLERVGVFGHSFGGGASVEFCARDPRCRAGVGLDAYVIPVTEPLRREGLRQPFLFLFSESWPSEPNTTIFDEIFSQSDDAAVFTILGTSHYDFTDLPMMSPIAPQLGLKGPLDGERVVQIIDAYTLALFDRALNGQPTALLDGPSPAYPEVVQP